MGKSFLDYLNPISAAVNAVTGFGSLIDTVTGGAENRARDMARYQFDLNEQAARNAYDRQVDFWNMQNEYNKPVNQMARYQEASINPNSVFGQVSGNAAPGSSAPQAAPADVSSAMSVQYQKQAMMLQAARQMAETQLIKAQKENVDADTKNKDADTTGKNISNTYQPQIYENTIQGQHVHTELEKKQTDLTVAEKDKVIKETAQIDASIDQIKANIEVLQENKKMLDQQTKNYVQQYMQNAEKFKHELAEIDSRTAANNAQRNLAYQTAQYYYAQTEGQNLENHRRELYNAVYEAIQGDEIQNAHERAAYARQLTRMITNDADIYDLKMPMLQKISPFMPLIDTANQGLDCLNKLMDVPGKFLDLSMKPMSFGTNLVDGVSKMGGKFVP